MFSCEICEIFKKTYFEEYLQTTVSEVSQILTSRTVISIAISGSPEISQIYIYLLLL